MAFVFWDQEGSLGRVDVVRVWGPAVKEGKLLGEEKWWRERGGYPWPILFIHEVSSVARAAATMALRIDGSSGFGKALEVFGVLRLGKWSWNWEKWVDENKRMRRMQARETKTTYFREAWRNKVMAERRNVVLLENERRRRRREEWK